MKFVNQLKNSINALVDDNSFINTLKGKSYTSTSADPIAGIVKIILNFDNSSEALISLVNIAINNCTSFLSENNDNNEDAIYLYLHMIHYSFRLLIQQSYDIAEELLDFLYFIGILLMLIALKL